jgi:DnaJ-class molecular chaperone
MSKRDYYDILDVSKGATADEIRTAHRRLVRKLHPDVNKESDASERFAEVQEAYDVLSDEEKRSRYDQLGHAGVSGQPGAGGQPGGGAWSDVDPETFESIFGDFFRGRGGAGPGQGDFGGGGGFDFGGFSGGGGQRQPRQRRGADLEHEITVPFMTAAVGGTETIRLAGGDGSVQSIEVKVPAGISTGATLRVRGKGNPGAAGGASGDLRLRVQVGPHPWFRREGLDLFLDVPISIAEAALGASIQLPLLKGSVTVRVPQATSSGAKLRVPGKGITDSGGKSGDFFALISISAPTDLSEENREQLESLRATLPDPRSGLSWVDVPDS